MRMKVLNLRMGFATNSSSTHSIVILPQLAEGKDDMYDNDFGWDYFTAGSVTSKGAYMAITLYENLLPLMTERSARYLVSKVLDIKEDALEGDIDHQSVMTLPKDYRGQMVDLTFARELSDYITYHPHIAILGGNDNDGESHPLAGNTQCNFQLPFDSIGRADLICRYDPSGYWSVFNKGDGTKVRLRLDEGEPLSIKSHTPELVDLKITDKCNMGCQFCTQSSTPGGVHGRTSDIDSILYYLAEMEVFEVALGGGETTQHPKFLDILKRGHGYGLTMNFTTKDLSWLDDQGYAEEVLQYTGGFAYSITNYHDVIKLSEKLRPLKSGKGSCHLVMGTVSRGEFTKILETCDDKYISIVLLGYKPVGFGEQYMAQGHVRDYSWWIDVVTDLKQRYKAPKLGIDTMLAKQYQDELTRAGIPQHLYQVHEGASSCYIDAVTMRMAPSSYCDKGLYKKLEYPSQIQEVWGELPVV